jgi:uncharacterized membrane protein
LTIIAVQEVAVAFRFGPGTGAAAPEMRAATVDFGRIVVLGAVVMTALFAINLPLGPRLPLPALISLGVSPLLVALTVGGARFSATVRELRERGLLGKLEGYHGLYYANANDRRLWVPKLSGMGWTINFSHPLGWPMMLLLLAVPIAVVVLSATAR